MLAAGMIIQIKGDPKPGRQYHVTGEAYGDGWWAYPLDGGVVAPELRRLSTSPRAAWVAVGDALPEGPSLLSAPLSATEQALPLFA